MGNADQVKLSRSFWKTRSRKGKSSLPYSLRSILKTLKVALRSRHENAFRKMGPNVPSMHWWIHITEVPLIGRDLAIRLHIPLARKQIELRFRKRGIDDCQRDAVEGSIPGRKEGVLPPS
jgi:hypothetical protein